jgi:VanZ family protein
MSFLEVQSAPVEAAPELRLARLWWAIGWGMVLFIAVSCLEPARYVLELHLWDKAEHALAFCGMSVWFGGLVRRSRYPLVGLAMLLLGGGIEIGQGVMGLGRDADILDFVADAVGITVALIFLYLGLGAWTRWVERLIWRSRDRAGSEGIPGGGDRERS